MALNITINKVSVAASFAAGATVATAVASGGTTPYVYSLATGGDKFAINSSTGVVTTIAAMDISNIASFSVTATDSTTGTALTGTSDVTYPPIQAATQNRFNRTNVIYKITRNIDLAGGILTIPAGCTLDFQGGTITNGTIIGNVTKIRANSRRVFENVTINGLWSQEIIYSDWFDFKKSPSIDDSLNFRNLMALCSDSINNTVYISGGDYYTNVDTEVTVMDVASNTTIYNSGVFHIIPTNQDTYRFFRVQDKNNITISGGTLIGDKDTHTGSSGEWGHGISIQGSANVLIQNITFSSFWGDGLEVSSSTTGKSKYVTIENCTITNSRRQGISVVGADKVKIDNCNISNVSGTSPQAGIDFEPFRAGEYNIDCVVSNCTFNNNSGAGILVYGKNKGINIFNCISNNLGLSVTAEGDVTAENCNFGSGLTLNIGEVVLNRCTFGGVEILSTAYEGKLGLNISNCTFGHNYITMAWFSNIFLFRDSTKEFNLEVNNSTIYITEAHPLELNPASFSYTPKLNGCTLILNGNMLQLAAFDCYNCVFDSVYRLYINNGRAVPLKIVNNFITFYKNSDSSYQYLEITNSSLVVPNRIISGNIFYVEEGFSQNWVKSSISNKTNSVIFSGNYIETNSEIEFLSKQILNATISIVGWNIDYYLRGASTFRPTSPSTGDLFYDSTLGKMIMYKINAWVNLDGTALA